MKTRDVVFFVAGLLLGAILFGGYMKFFVTNALLNADDDVVVTGGSLRIQSNDGFKSNGAQEADYKGAARTETSDKFKNVPNTSDLGSGPATIAIAYCDQDPCKHGTDQPEDTITIQIGPGGQGLTVTSLHGDLGTHADNSPTDFSHTQDWVVKRITVNGTKHDCGAKNSQPTITVHEH
jgi:hypothetical protein